MAVPKRRVCPSRKGMRRSHQALEVPAISLDTKTKSRHRPHHIDLITGFYNGKKVLNNDRPASPDQA
jgi:large subunit ribosomal protein L32